MKKRILALLLCMTTLFTMAGCGTGDNDTESTEESVIRSGQIDIDPEKLVTSLADYVAIPVTITGDYEVTDEEVEEQVMSMLSYYGLNTVEITDRTTVQEGDIVNVDYTGYFNGEAFDNGAATDQLIDVSNNSSTSGSTYIDGFSDGLLGAEVGSTINHDVTFPESYPNNPDLAGQLTTFEFKINGIYTQVSSSSEVSDEAVAAQLEEAAGITTVQGLRDYLKDYLEYTASNDQYSDTVDAIKIYLIENSEVTVPQDYLEARVREYQASFEADYLEDGEDIATYVTENYNMTLEEVQEEWTAYMTEQIQTELIFSVIAEKEGIELDQEEFDSFVQNFVDNANYGFDDTNAVYEYFGNGYADEGETYMKQLYLVNKAIDVVSESAVVTITPESEESTEQ